MHTLRAHGCALVSTHVLLVTTLFAMITTSTHPNQTAFDFSAMTPRPTALRRGRPRASAIPQPIITASSPVEIARALQAAKAMHPDDAKAQVTYLFDHIRIPAATGQGTRKGRPVSEKTKVKYFESAMYLVNTLTKIRAKPDSLDEITLKNVRSVVQDWEANKLSASTIATRYTCITRFLNLIGKPTEFPPLAEMLKNADNGKRNYSAIDPNKAWRDTGLDIEQTIQNVATQCQFTAIALRLCQAFGLRVQEALMLRPQHDVHGDTLGIMRGAKGGRGRLIPIETDLQRAAIAQALEKINPRTGCIGPYPTLQRNRNRFYYVLKNQGITRDTLKATAHGLRHQYLNDAYERLTGHKSPVNGGPKITPEEDRRVREQLSLRSGHTRTDIVSAYIGTSRHINTMTKKCLDQLISELEGCTPLVEFVQSHRNQLDAHGWTLGIYLAGDTLKLRSLQPGQMIAATMSLTPKPCNANEDANIKLTLQLQMQAQLTQIALTHCKRLLVFLPVSCFCANDRLEVLFHRAAD